MRNGGNTVKTVLASSFLGWLVSSFILFLVFHVQADQSEHPMAYQIVAIAFVIAFYALPITLGAAAILGTAWHTHATKRSLRKLSTYLFAGLLRGAGVGAISSIAFLVLFGPAWWVWSLVGTLYSATIGVFTGLFMWLDLRPDRDAANPTTSAP